VRRSCIDLFPYIPSHPAAAAAATAAALGRFYCSAHCKSCAGAPTGSVTSKKTREHQPCCESVPLKPVFVSVVPRVRVVFTLIGCCWGSREFRLDRTPKTMPMSAPAQACYFHPTQLTQRKAPAHFFDATKASDARKVRKQVHNDATVLRSLLRYVRCVCCVGWKLRFTLQQPSCGCVFTASAAVTGSNATSASHGPTVLNCPAFCRPI